MRIHDAWWMALGALVAVSPICAHGQIQRGFSGGGIDSLGTVTYAFDGNDECPTSDDGPHVLSREGFFTDFERVGLDCSNADGAFSSWDWPTGEARADTAYVGFSGTAPGDAPFSFVEGSQLSFTVRRSESGPANGEVLYFPEPAAPVSLGTWMLDDAGDHQFSFPLSEIGITTFIEFRFYAWGAATDEGILRFDDIALSFAIATGVEGVRGTPRRPLVGKIYPNPVRSTAVVPLDVQNPDHVRLVIHDMLGRQVAVLRGELFVAGRREITVDVSTYAAGVYLARVSGASGSASQSFTVMK